MAPGQCPAHLAGLAFELAHPQPARALAAEPAPAHAPDPGAPPQAVLRCRQGFGRLSRGADERGVFLVLDSRIASRRYGQTFLDALPDCELRHLRASAVADAVESWLAR